MGKELSLRFQYAILYLYCYYFVSALWGNMQYSKNNLRIACNTTQAIETLDLWYKKERNSLLQQIPRYILIHHGTQYGPVILLDFEKEKVSWIGLDETFLKCKVIETTICPDLRNVSSVADWKDQLPCWGAIMQTNQTWNCYKSVRVANAVVSLSEWFIATCN